MMHHDAKKGEKTRKNNAKTVQNSLFSVAFEQKTPNKNKKRTRKAKKYRL